jgi:hypothetical protein
MLQIYLRVSTGPSIFHGIRRIIPAKPSERAFCLSDESRPIVLSRKTSPIASFVLPSRFCRLVPATREKTSILSASAVLLASNSRSHLKLICLRANQVDKRKVIVLESGVAVFAQAVLPPDFCRVPPYWTGTNRELELNSSTSPRRHGRAPRYPEWPPWSVSRPLRSFRLSTSQRRSPVYRIRDSYSRLPQTPRQASKEQCQSSSCAHR